MVTEKQVDAILKKNKKALEAQLSMHAIKTASDVATDKYKKEVVSKVAKEYVKQYAKGGSFCPDPNNLGKAKFVSWIDESYANAKTDIMKYLDAYDASKNSSELAKALGETFKEKELTGNPAADINRIMNADIDARRVMRTETEKIRTAAKIENMKANDVEYVRYIAVMDDRVRPEHAALNGQIFPIDEAPILGEPNCRCTYGTATVKQYKAEKDKYEGKEWTAKDAQDWLKTSNGKVTGYKNAIQAKEQVTEKRQIFNEGFPHLTPNERLNLVIETNDRYKPDWCRVSILDIIDLDASLLKPLEHAQKVVDETVNVPIEMPRSVITQSEWDEPSLKFLEIQMDTLNEGVCKDFNVQPLVRSIRSDSTYKSAGAFYDYTQRFIGVNPKDVAIRAKNIRDGVYIEPVKKTVSLDGRVVPFVTPDKQVLTHEIGHGLHFNVTEFMKAPDKNGEKLLESDFFKAFSKRYPQYDTSNIKKFVTKYSPTGYGAEKGMGNYGNELIAECFADFYDKGEKADQISKDMVAFFKEVYNDWNLTGKTLPELRRMKTLIDGNELFEKGAIKGLRKEIPIKDLWKLNEATKKGMTPEAIKRYEDSVKVAKETVLKDFPNLIRDYNDIKIVSAGRKSQFAWGVETINFNPSEFQTILEDIKAGYKLKGSENYQLVHHMGVELFHNAMGAKTFANIDKHKADILTFWREFAIHEKSDILDPKKVKSYKALEARMKEVYNEGKLTVVNGSTDYFAGEELIGEAVVDYYLNGANASPFSKSVMNFLKFKISGRV